MSDGTTSILITKEAGVNYSRLVDAKVRIRATPVLCLTARRRQMIGVRIHVPISQRWKFLEPAPGDPFKLPVMPSTGCCSGMWLLAGPPVHVRDRSRCNGRSSVCIRMPRAGYPQTIQTTRLRSGEIVDIAGFARQKEARRYSLRGLQRRGLAAPHPSQPFPGDS